MSKNDTNDLYASLTSYERLELAKYQEKLKHDQEQARLERKHQENLSSDKGVRAIGVACAIALAIAFAAQACAAETAIPYRPDNRTDPVDTENLKATPKVQSSNQNTYSLKP